MDLVSIIVPVYNAEKTIERCLRSLQNQTYDKIEIIFVNDGSKDCSEQIILEFAKKDTRIIYSRQENQGVSSARNKGLQLASGKYIAFCDSDDYVKYEYIEKMMESRNRHNSDWVIAGYERISEKTVVYCDIYKSEVIDERNMSDFFADWYRNTFVTGPCGKIYDASLIKENQICFLVEKYMMRHL